MNSPGCISTLELDLARRCILVAHEKHPECTPGSTVSLFTDCNYPDGIGEC